MAIPKAQDNRLGQQIEQATQGPKHSPLANEPALFAAQAIKRSYDELANDISRGVKQGVDVLRDAQIAVEQVRAVEAKSELERREALARLEIDTEEKEFIKTNNRLFTPEEYKERYQSKVGAIVGDINSKYKFDWMRDKVSTELTSYVESRATNYETTVIHPKAIDAVGMSLNNTMVNMIDQLKDMKAAGANEIELADQYKKIKDHLNDPTWIYVKREGHGVWKAEADIKLRNQLLGIMTPDERATLIEKYNVDKDGVLATPIGQALGVEFLGSAEAQEMGIRDRRTVDSIKEYNERQVLKVQTEQAEKLEFGLTTAAYNVEIGNGVWDMTKHMSEIDAAVNSGAISEEHGMKLKTQAMKTDVAIRNEALKKQKEARAASAPAAGSNDNPLIFGAYNAKDNKIVEAQVGTALASNPQLAYQMTAQHLVSAPSPHFPVVIQVDLARRFNSGDVEQQKTALATMAQFVQTPFGAAGIQKMGPGYFAAANIYAKTGSLEQALSTFKQVQTTPPQVFKDRDSQFDANSSVDKLPQLYVDAARNTKLYPGFSISGAPQEFLLQVERGAKEIMRYNPTMPVNEAIEQSMKLARAQGWNVVQRGKRNVVEFNPPEDHLHFKDDNERAAVMKSVETELGLPKGTEIQLRWNPNSAGEKAFNIHVKKPGETTFSRVGNVTVDAMNTEITAVRAKIKAQADKKYHEKDVERLKGVEKDIEKDTDTKTKPLGYFSDVPSP